MAKYTGNRHKVSLTTDEVYTLLLLLGKVAGDNESYNLYERLSCMLEREVLMEDFDKVKFVGETQDECWYIRIEEGEKE